jgi:hypothetical protein
VGPQCYSPITSQSQQVRPESIRQQIQLPLLQDPMIQQRLKNLRYWRAMRGTAAAAAALLLLPLVLPLDVFLTARYRHDHVCARQYADC